MPFFLSEQPLRPGESFILAGAEARHLLQARRARPGARFALQDPTGNRFEAELESFRNGKAAFRVLEPLPVPALPALKLTLAQAAVKAKATEWIIQKATEVGVAAIAFFPAENSIVPARELRDAQSKGRWERIAWEACKQSDRRFPPELHLLPGLDAVLAARPAGEAAWLFHPVGGLTPGEVTPAIPSPAKPSSALALVGPEGGFSETETALAERAGCIPVRLGEQTLRAETAALVACGLLLFGELGNRDAG